MNRGHWYKSRWLCSPLYDTKADTAFAKALEWARKEFGGRPLKSPREEEKKGIKFLQSEHMRLRDKVRSIAGWYSPVTSDVADAVETELHAEKMDNEVTMEDFEKIMEELSHELLRMEAALINDLFKNDRRFTLLNKEFGTYGTDYIHIVEVMRGHESERMIKKYPEYRGTSDMIVKFIKRFKARTRV